MDSDQDNETYILLLLSDSNLPTGSFVASSGLESYVKHGFPTSAPASAAQATVDFVRDSLASYAKSALPFVSDAHSVAEKFALESANRQDDGENLQDALRRLTELDELYQTMTLNHVARRASMAQGVALLTLYSKGFSRPSSLSTFPTTKSPDLEIQMAKLIDELKLRIRREEIPGHLPVCWSVLTAALGMTLERSQYLHLFLHARSLLSAAVRLNDLGPYGSQQILLHALRPLVAAEASRSAGLRTGILENIGSAFNDATMGPANTWPLGEILAGRHDLQHSRIFNS